MINFYILAIIHDRKNYFLKIFLRLRPFVAHSLTVETLFGIARNAKQYSVRFSLLAVYAYTPYIQYLFDWIFGY